MTKMMNTVDMARALLQEEALDRSLAPDVTRAAAGDKAAEKRLEQAIDEFVKAHPDGYEGKHVRFKFPRNMGKPPPGREAMMRGTSPAKLTWLVNQLVLRGVDRGAAESMAPLIPNESDKVKMRELLNAAATRYKSGEASPFAAAPAPDVDRAGEELEAFVDILDKEFVLNRETLAYISAAAMARSEETGAPAEDLARRVIRLYGDALRSMEEELMKPSVVHAILRRAIKADALQVMAFTEDDYIRSILAANPSFSDVTELFVQYVLRTFFQSDLEGIQEADRAVMSFVLANGLPEAVAHGISAYEGLQVDSDKAIAHAEKDIRNFEAIFHRFEGTGLERYTAKSALIMAAFERNEEEAVAKAELVMNYVSEVKDLLAAEGMSETTAYAMATDMAVVSTDLDGAKALAMERLGIARIVKERVDSSGIGDMADIIPFMFNNAPDIDTATARTEYLIRAYKLMLADPAFNALPFNSRYGILVKTMTTIPLDTLFSDDGPTRAAEMAREFTSVATSPEHSKVAGDPVSTSVVSVPDTREALEKLGVPAAYADDVIDAAVKIIVEKSGVEGLQDAPLKMVALDNGSHFVKAMRILIEEGEGRERAEQVASEVAPKMSFNADIKDLQLKIEDAVGRPLSPEIVNRVHLEVEKQLYGMMAEDAPVSAVEGSPLFDAMRQMVDEGEFDASILEDAERAMGGDHEAMARIDRAIAERTDVGVNEFREDIGERAREMGVDLSNVGPLTSTGTTKAESAEQYAAFLFRDFNFGEGMLRAIADAAFGHLDESTRNHIQALTAVANMVALQITRSSNIPIATTRMATEMVVAKWADRFAGWIAKGIDGRTDEISESLVKELVDAVAREAMEIVVSQEHVVSRMTLAARIFAREMEPLLANRVALTQALVGETEADFERMLENYRAVVEHLRGTKFEEGAERIAALSRIDEGEAIAKASADRFVRNYGQVRTHIKQRGADEATAIAIFDMVTQGTSVEFEEIRGMAKQLADAYAQAINKLRLTGFRDYAPRAALAMAASSQFSATMISQAIEVFHIVLKYLESEEVPDGPARGLAASVSARIAEDQAPLNQKPEDVAPAMAANLLENYRWALETLAEKGIGGDEAVELAIGAANIPDREWALAHLENGIASIKGRNGNGENSGGSTPVTPAGSGSGPATPPTGGNYDASSHGMEDLLARSAGAVHGLQRQAAEQFAGRQQTISAPILQGAATAFGGVQAGLPGGVISAMPTGAMPMSMARPIGL